MRQEVTHWLLVLAMLAAAGSARADVKSKAATEAAEYVMARFGRQATKEGVAALAAKIESYAARYGEEEVVMAMRRAGPEAFALVDAAGANGPKAVRMLAKYGEEGATALRQPKALSLISRYGDDAAAVLVKHPGIASSLLEKEGAAAVKALGAVSQQNGRRVAMLMEGEIGKLPESGKLMGIFGQYGNRAANYVWENKGALAVGTTLAVFVAEPEPFLDGVRKLAEVPATTVAKPLAEGVAKGTNWTVVVLVWTLLFLAAVAAGGFVLAAKLGLLHKLASGESGTAGHRAAN